MRTEANPFGHRWRDLRSCEQCRRPFAECSALTLELYKRQPGPDFFDDARIVCPHCDEPCPSYWITLDELARNGLAGADGWLAHIRRKVWFRWWMADALEAGRDKAVALRAERDRPALVVHTPARRKPRPKPSARHISPRTRTRVLERDGFRCRRCGVGPERATLVVDHVVPVSAGGSRDLANLQTLCDPCNAGKAASLPHAHDLRTAEVYP